MAGKLKTPLQFVNPAGLLKQLRGMPLLKKGGKSAVILSYTDQWLKLLAQRSEGGKTHVRLLKALPIKDMPDSERIKAITEQLDSSQALKPAFTVSIASFFVRSHYLKLPSVDPGELKIMVELQVEKLTPDSKDEMMTTYRPIKTTQEGYTSLLLLMAHNDMISPAVKTVETMGGNLKAVTSDVDGLINWISALQKMQHDAAEDAVLLADIDSDYTTLLIAQGGEAFFHRSIPIGASHLQADTNNQRRLIGELHRSMIAFKEDDQGFPVSKIILTGLAEDFQEIAAEVEKEEAVPAQTVSSFLPFELSRVKLPERAEVSFTSLLGLAASPAVSDLMPAATRLRRAFHRRVRAVIRLGAQLLVALIVLAMILLNSISRNSDYEALLKERVNATAPEARRIEMSLVALKIIRERLEGKGQLLASFMDMNNATSDSVQWDTFTYTKDDGVLLKGTAGEMPQIFEMVTELEKSSLFLQPKARRVAKKKVNDQDIAEFEIDAPFFREGTNETEAD